MSSVASSPDLPSRDSKRSYWICSEFQAEWLLHQSTYKTQTLMETRMSSITTG